MTHIIDNIYLGNCKNAKHFQGFIINVSADCPMWLNGGVHIKLDDSPYENILKYFNRVNHLIEKHKNEPILIHCMMGISRSASFVIAYIMNRFGLNLQKAFHFVRRKRPIIRPNSGFIEQLEMYEKQLHIQK